MFDEAYSGDTNQWIIHYANFISVNIKEASIQFFKNLKDNFKKNEKQIN